MKKLLKFLLIFSITTLIFVFLFIQYLKSDWNRQITRQEIQLFRNNLEESPEKINDFIEVYLKINKIESLNKKLFYEITGVENTVDCPCLYLASQSRITLGKNRFTGNEYVLTMKLEKEFSQVECLKIFANNYDFLYGNIGLKKASNFYFQKEFEQLSCREMAILVIMLENSSLYNYKKEIGKKRIDEKLKEYNF